MVKKKKELKHECDLYRPSNPHGDICELDDKTCGYNRNALICPKVVVVNFLIKEA